MKRKSIIFLLLIYVAIIGVLALGAAALNPHPKTATSESEVVESVWPKEMKGRIPEPKFRLTEYPINPMPGQTSYHAYNLSKETVIDYAETLKRSGFKTASETFDDEVYAYEGTKNGYYVSVIYVDEYTTTVTVAKQ